MNSVYVEDIASAITCIAEEIEHIARKTPNLRELAAVAAMQGLLSRAREIDAQTIASIAVQCADELVKKLKEK